MTTTYLFPTSGKQWHLFPSLQVDKDTCLLSSSGGSGGVCHWLNENRKNIESYKEECQEMCVCSLGSGRSTTDAKSFDIRSLEH